jgi:hypothetical protein
MAIPDHQSNLRLTVIAAIVLAMITIASVIARLLVPVWEAWWK